MCAPLVKWTLLVLGALAATTGASHYYRDTRGYSDAREVRDTRITARDESAERRIRNGWRAPGATDETVRVVNASSTEAARWHTIVHDDDRGSWPGLLVVVPPYAGEDRRVTREPTRGVAYIDVLDVYCPGDVYEVWAEPQDADYDLAAGTWGRETPALEQSIAAQRKNERRGRKRKHKSRKHAPPGESRALPPADLRVVTSAVVSASAGEGGCDTWTSAPETALLGKQLWSRGVLVLPGSRRRERVYFVQLRSLASPYGGGAVAVRVRYGEMPQPERLHRTVHDQDKV